MMKINLILFILLFVINNAYSLCQLSGMENNKFALYHDIAEKTGGKVIDGNLDIFTKDFYPDIDSLPSIFHQNNINWQITIPIDSSITKAIFNISSMEKNNIQIISPQGQTLSLENLNNNIKTFKNTSSCLIKLDDPVMAGNWQILSTNQRPFNINIQANTNISFQSIKFLRKELGGKHGLDFFPINDGNIKNSDLIQFNITASKQKIKEFTKLNFFNHENEIINTMNIVDCPVPDEKSLTNYILYGTFLSFIDSKLHIKVSSLTDLIFYTKISSFWMPKEHVCYQYYDDSVINNYELRLATKALKNSSILSYVELTGIDNNNFIFVRNVYLKSDKISSN